MKVVDLSIALKEAADHPVESSSSFQLFSGIGIELLYRYVECSPVALQSSRNLLEFYSAVVKVMGYRQLNRH